MRPRAVGLGVVISCHVASLFLCQQKLPTLQKTGRDGLNPKLCANMQSEENAGSWVHTIMESLAASAPRTAIPISPDCTLTFVDETGATVMMQVQQIMNSTSNLPCKDECELTYVARMLEHMCCALQHVGTSMQHTDNSLNDPNLTCTV